MPMIHKIPLTHPILNSPLFKKDEIAFNIIPFLIQNQERYPDIRLFSDERDIILLNTDSNHPVIVWTSEQFDNFKMLYDFLIQTFKDNTPIQLMTKKEVYDFFNTQNLILNKNKTDILGAYHCTKVNPIPQIGTLDTAKSEELDIIKNLLLAFDKEAQPNENRPLEYYVKEAQKFIDKSDSYKVWRDETGLITSIGRLEIVDTQARIGRIYTLPNHRGKSYAKMLVQNLTKHALQLNLLPVLYTNFQYEPSNKCYQAIGFELLDTIFTYHVKK